jgi:hypothetical protein
MANNNNDYAVAGILGALGLGLLGAAVAHERSLTPAERAARARRREAEREAEEQRRAAERRAQAEREEQLRSAPVEGMRTDPLADLIGALSGKATEAATVAVYSGVSTFGRPAKVINLRGTAEWNDMMFTAREGGVEVRWFGRFGPEREFIRAGGSEYLFGQRLTIAVL